MTCRFNFGHFFTNQTTVAKPLQVDMESDERDKILKERELLLSKVKKVIDEVLNPSNQSNYVPGMTIKQVLDMIHVDEDKY